MLIIVLMTLTSLTVILAFVLYAYLINRYPFFNNWIATSSICIHHTQSAMLLASQISVQNSLAARVANAAFAAFSDLTVLRPECLLPQATPTPCRGRHYPRLRLL